MSLPSATSAAVVNAKNNNYGLALLVSLIRQVKSCSGKQKICRCVLLKDVVVRVSGNKNFFFFNLLSSFFTTGVVSSPNYPGNYPNIPLMTEVIQVQRDMRVLLQFTAFEIGATEDGYGYGLGYNRDGITGCNDYLEITDKDGTILLPPSCGSTLPFAIKSKSNSVKLTFRTNGRFTGMGWSANWTAITPGKCHLHSLTLSLWEIGIPPFELKCIQI